MLWPTPRERAVAGLAKAWPRAGLQRRLPGASRAIWKYFYYKIPTLKTLQPCDRRMCGLGSNFVEQMHMEFPWEFLL